MTRALLVGLVFAVVPWGVACSSGGGEKKGEQPSGPTFNIEIDLAPEVEARLLQLVDELNAIICQRADNCCESLGFQPLNDCNLMASGPFTDRLFKISWIDRDIDELDITIDERFATACLDAAVSVVNDCTFQAEDLIFNWAWYDPCAHALRATPKGETPVECEDDIDCQIIDPARPHCRSDVCVPDVVVPVGGSCAIEPGSVRACGGDGNCNAGICEPRQILNETCSRGLDECVEGLTCIEPVGSTDASEMRCVPLRQKGEACHSDYDCIDDFCHCDGGCFCDKRVGLGDPCVVDADCGRLRCWQGACQLLSPGFCEQP